MSFGGPLRKPKQDKTKQAERKQRANFAEIKEQAEVVHTMAQTDKDVETLKKKLRELTKEISDEGTPLMNYFQKMNPVDITMLMTEIAATTNMGTRMTHITETVLPEAKTIREKAESLQETVQVAEMTIRLAYDKEFAVGSQSGGAGGLIPTLKFIAQGGLKPDARKACFTLDFASPEARCLGGIFHLKTGDAREASFILRCEMLGRHLSS